MYNVQKIKSIIPYPHAIYCLALMWYGWMKWFLAPVRQKTSHMDILLRHSVCAYKQYAQVFTVPGELSIVPCPQYTYILFGIDVVWLDGWMKWF